jgi:hypothetical protein
VRQQARWGRSIWLPLALYAVLGLAAYFPTWPGDPSGIPQCTCADAGLNTWFLAATAHAVAHGHNLFYTAALNSPRGVNLTYNTQMPLLGLITVPLTLTAGPIASLNLLMWLAFPLSAISMYLVLRRWTSWTPAAFVGGLLYGFSPYMVGQSSAHLFLIFVPLPPLILLATFELLVRRVGDPRRWGLALGLLSAAQFLISSEILVTTALVTLVGLAILASARPHQVMPALSGAGPGLAWGLTVFVALLAYPVTVFLTGPAHYTSAFDSSTGILIRADLLGPVVPTSAERLVPAAWAATGDRLTALGDYSENGSYLGIPLLLVLTALLWRCRLLPWSRFAAIMTVATFVLSLGSPLSVDGHSTGIPLPDALLRHVPLIDQFVPARMSLFTVLFAAVVLSLGLDEVAAARHSPSRRVALREADAHGRHLGRTGVAATAVISVLVVVSLLPRWPEPTVPAGVPNYFTSAQVQRIDPGTVALTYPYAAPLHAQSMVWQAAAGLRFSLVGGYALIPDARGVPTLFPSQLEPDAVQNFLIAQEGGVPFYRDPTVGDNAVLARAVRQFIWRYHVGVVLVDPSAPNAGVVSRLITRALGRPPVLGGAMRTWYDAGDLSSVGATP